MMRGLTPRSSRDGSRSFRSMPPPTPPGVFNCNAYARVSATQRDWSENMFGTERKASYGRRAAMHADFMDTEERPRHVPAGDYRTGEAALEYKMPDVGVS